MTAVYIYNGVDLGNQSVRLGSISGLTQKAELGTVATSDMSFDDPTGTGLLLPLRSFVVRENAAGGSRVYSGYSAERTIRRADSLLTGGARRITASFVDLNAIFNFKIIQHTTFHYKRPAETDIERITWLISGSANLMTIDDLGLVDASNPVNLSAVDYTGQFPMQVLQDCSDRSGKNFFAYSDPATDLTGLAYFTSTDAAFYPSTISISNVRSDLSSTCFAPTDPELSLDPSQVYDGVYMPYSGGAVYVQTPRILRRDTVAPSANTSSRTAAIALATKFLAAAGLEDERVTCTIKVPAAKVNDILAGMMVNARFTNYTGWETGLDVRVLERSVKQDEESDAFYNIGLVLGHPLIVDFTSGPGGDNTRVWPSDQPPFVPGTSGGTPDYVQSEKLQSAGGTSPETITLGAAPTAGNFLGIYIGQVQSSAVNTYTLPDGWDIDDVYDPPGSAAPADFCRMLLASKISDGTETSVLVSWSGTGPLEIFYFEYSGASGYGGFAHGQQAGSSTFTLPSVTPTPNLPTAVLGFLNWDPDYTVVSPLANTREFQTRSGWAARAAQSYSDTIISSATGSYDGTTSGTVGPETGYAAIVTWLTGGSLTHPAIGQPVAPESATADGSRVIYQTNYPYIPGSLVVKVNGNVVVVDETDPDTGMFTLPAPPAAGAIITWTYNVADPEPTGANNPQASPSGPAVPPSDGTVLGGDGVYRQPSQAYIPAETPNGVITVFTIPPYIAGSTLVYINGLIQRLTTDYTESSPGTGAITFVTAPWTGAEIIIVAMPAGASPSPTGTRSVTWGPPVTTATVVIPGSIDPTGATDVTASMNAWVASVPDGRILDFDGGTFKLTQGIQLQNRHNLVLWGNGATLNVDAGASGSNQLSSSIVLGHGYGGSWGGNNTDIAIHDFTIVGNDPTPGTFTPGTESESNLWLTWSTRVEVYDITGSAAYSDGATYDRITDVWMHDCHFPTAGRNGVSVLSGTRILVETSDFDVSGFCTFDVEPDDITQACTNITFRSNTAQTWGNLFFAMEGSHTGAPIHTVTVTGNTISTDSLETIVDNGNTSRMTNFSFTNNVSLGGSVAGPVITVKYTDNVTVTGNVQTHSGALTSFTSCTNTVT